MRWRNDVGFLLTGCQVFRGMRTQAVMPMVVILDYSHQVSLGCVFSAVESRHVVADWL